MYFAALVAILLAVSSVSADQAQYIYDDLGRLVQVIDGQWNLSGAAVMIESIRRLELERKVHDLFALSHQFRGKLS